MTSPRRSPDLGPILLVSAIAAAMLATWLPQYLRWPWWPDLDAWATIAQGWDSGMRPYRDVVIFNFPGQIYLCWILGHVAGWGRTWPFYALDASLILALGGLLVVWARNGFGRILPGLIGWVATLSVYLDLDYGMVAQRDWQAPLLAAMSLLILQTWPRSAGQLVSSALMAMGFAIRPHVVLLLPAILLILLFGRDAGTSWPSKIRRAATWGALFAAFVAMAFLPLLLQGLMGDFVGGVRQASYGSGYGRATPETVALGSLRQLGLIGVRSAFSSREEFLAHLVGWKVLFTISALIAMIATATADHRRLALPWLVALAMAVLYEPLHPKRHAYLALPLRLFWALGWGVLSGLVLERLRPRPIPALLAFLAFLIVAVPGVPRFCEPRASLDALLGRESTRVPATAAGRFFPGDANTPYRWEDYRAALEFVRSRTDPATPVAVALRTVPFPAFNGVLGRVSPWPAESGVIWLWSVNPKLEAAFVSALEKTPPGTVVVWSPGEKAFDERLKLQSLCSSIRLRFHPVAKFGSIEVWRK